MCATELTALCQGLYGVESRGQRAEDRKDGRVSAVAAAACGEVEARAVDSIQEAPAVTPGTKVHRKRGHLNHL